MEYSQRKKAARQDSNVLQNCPLIGSYPQQLHTPTRQLDHPGTHDAVSASAAYSECTPLFILSQHHKDLESAARDVQAACQSSPPCKRSPIFNRAFICTSIGSDDRICTEVRKYPARRVMNLLEKENKLSSFQLLADLP